MEKIVRQVGHLPELHEDARSEKYKIYAVNTEILSWTFKLSSKQELYRIFSMMENASFLLQCVIPVHQILTDFTRKNIWLYSH